MKFLKTQYQIIISTFLVFTTIIWPYVLLGQKEKLVNAQKLYKSKDYGLAAIVIDSVVLNPQTSRDYVAWSTRAYIYFYLHKSTQNLALGSKLLDTALVSLKKSNHFEPDSLYRDLNFKLLTSIYKKYFNLAIILLVDSMNFDRSLIAYKRYTKLREEADTSYKSGAISGEYYMARSTMALEIYGNKWIKNKEVDTNEYILIKKEINTLYQLGNNAISVQKKENSAFDNPILTSAKLCDALLNSKYNTARMHKYQDEFIEKQTQLGISHTKNLLAQLEIEKRNNDIELLNSKVSLSKLQVEKQKRGIELLRKEKALELAKVEKQEIEAKKREEELRQQRILRNISLVGVLLLFIVVFLIYRNLTINRKQNRIILSQKEEVEKKNILISEQKLLVEEKHKEITDSINYAERIQRSFLATKDLLDTNLKDYFVLFQPKEAVSGDFYWAGHLSNGNFALITADSTGHGVPGAIMSILNISCLENAIREKLWEPKDILNHTRTNIIERLKNDGSKEGGKDGMDCSLISFNFNSFQLTYSGAHNPVWVIRNKELLELEPDKMPVGKHDKDQISFNQLKFELQSGDVIYTLTDGYPDQFGGPRGKKFMYKQLKDLLQSLAHRPMQEQKEILLHTLADWRGSAEQVDDITLIGLRV